MHNSGEDSEQRCHRRITLKRNVVEKKKKKEIEDEKYECKGKKKRILSTHLILKVLWTFT